MERVLILAGDAVEDLELFFILYRLREAGYEVDVAALTRRTMRTVVHDFEPDSDAYVEKPGRRLEPDLAFSEVEPERYVGVVIPGGRAPEYIRVDPDVRGSSPTSSTTTCRSGRSATDRRSRRPSATSRGARAPASRRSDRTSRPPAAPMSREPTSSTGTWSRAAAGATSPSGRRRSSRCSSAPRCRRNDDSRRASGGLFQRSCQRGAPVVDAPARRAPTSTRSTGSSSRARSALDDRVVVLLADPGAGEPQPAVAADHDVAEYERSRARGSSRRARPTGRAATSTPAGVSPTVPPYRSASSAEDAPVGVDGQQHAHRPPEALDVAVERFEEPVAVLHRHQRVDEHDRLRRLVEDAADLLLPSRPGRRRPASSRGGGPSTSHRPVAISWTRISPLSWQAKVVLTRKETS